MMVKFESKKQLEELKIKAASYDTLIKFIYDEIDVALSIKGNITNEAVEMNLIQDVKIQVYKKLLATMGEVYVSI